ncbi:unnamed protein product [Diamesa serratosioi]
MGLVLYLVFGVVYLFYKWATSTYDYFEKRGLPFRKPVPLFGNNFKVISRKISMMDYLQMICSEFKDEKISGFFEFRKPVVMVKDPKLIKQLAVKNFDYFMDRRTMITEEMDPIFGKALVSLTGQKWRDMRSTLSPAFTGSKMRQMFEYVSQCGQQTAISMKKEIIAGGDNVFEFKDLATKFTVDVIASCAFGIEVNSFTNPENDFQRIAAKITNFTSYSTVLKFAGYMLAPKIMKFFKIKFFDNDTSDFFRYAIKETMKNREEKGIIRHDMIDLLIQARKGKLTHTVREEEVIADGFATVEESNVGKSQVTRVWDDDDLAAQCFIFFFAGFETVSTTMTLAAYELTANPDLQTKLRDEIDEMNKELDGKMINYEQIQKMKYMDAFICETLRKWPLAPFVDRICVKDYELKYDDKSFLFEKDMCFFIPIWCLHQDPEYFPDPEKFDPERFSVENRGKIDPDTYVPFGVGPRNCIGSRFAIMEIKTVLYYLLLNFTFDITEKTQIPLKLENSPIQLKIEKGVWIALNPRN